MCLYLIEPFVRNLNLRARKKCGINCNIIILILSLKNIKKNRQNLIIIIRQKFFQKDLLIIRK